MIDAVIISVVYDLINSTNNNNVDWKFGKNVFFNKNNNDYNMYLKADTYSSGKNMEYIFHILSNEKYEFTIKFMDEENLSYTVSSNFRDGKLISKFLFALMTSILNNKENN